MKTHPLRASSLFYLSVAGKTIAKCGISFPLGHIDDTGVAEEQKPTDVAEVEQQGSKASPLPACENIPLLLVITQHACYIDTHIISAFFFYNRVTNNALQG